MKLYLFKYWNKFDGISVKGTCLECRFEKFEHTKAFLLTTKNQEQQRTHRVLSTAEQYLYHQRQSGLKQSKNADSELK